jgi:hypothetical protein
MSSPQINQSRATPGLLMGKQKNRLEQEGQMLEKNKECLKTVSSKLHWLEAVHMNFSKHMNIQKSIDNNRKRNCEDYIPKCSSIRVWIP